MTSILTADMGKNPISYSLLSIQPLHPPQKKNPPGFGTYNDIQLCFSTPVFQASTPKRVTYRWAYDASSE